MVHSSLFIDNRKQTSDIRGFPMAIENQNLSREMAHAYLTGNAPKIENPVIYVPIRHLYNCREPSTNQPFLCKTNPILSAVGGLQMNANLYNTTDYERKRDWTLGENKPNTNPIQTQFKPKQTQSPKGQNECKLTYNKGLQKKR